MIVKLLNKGKKTILFDQIIFKKMRNKMKPLKISKWNSNALNCQQFVIIVADIEEYAF